MDYDFLIVGQGIAGSTLALELLQRGVRVLVVDRQDQGSSSRVAAGLITPITGKGLNPAWRQDEYLPVAEKFYQSLEDEVRGRFYHPCEVVRLFQSAREQEKWRSKSAEHRKWGEEKELADDALKSEYGGLKMSGGAWLDSQKFLTAVQNKLVAEDSYRVDDFCEQEVEFGEGGVTWRDVTAGKIILCQGAYGLQGGGWFSDVPHRCAKGEIITVKLAGLPKDTRYHADGWLAARGDGTWKVGATYDWKNLNSEVTEQGRDEVLGKLATWCDLPVAVVDQEAGVRPIIRNSRPVIGLHPKYEEVGFFNGLGSKGSLIAPAVASHFADVLTGKSELDPELSIPFTASESVAGTIATGNLLKTAHQLASEAVAAGDVVMDTTVGNGHDTLFLTSLVGAGGQVIGFDIQQQAIESATKRLTAEGVIMNSVMLHQESHAQMKQMVGDDLLGKVACVMFNLGYLPGADKSIITQLESTLSALQQATEYLKSGGLLSVMCYPGHAGGDREAAEVKKWMMSLPREEFTVDHYVRNESRESTPFLLVAHKK